MDRGRPTGRRGAARSAAAFLAMLVLTAGAALATTFRDRPVDCPVCAKPFTALEVRSANTFGGYDSDLCVHAKGTPPSSFQVWTCPSCRYSARAPAFAKGVSGATKKKLLSGWPEAPVGIPAAATQREIPAWKKYEIAGRILDEEGARPSDRLRIWRDAAFAERCAANELLDPVRKDPGFSAAMERIEDARREASPATDGLRTRAGRYMFAARSLLEADAKAPAGERSARDLAAGAVLRGRGEFETSTEALRRAAESKGGSPAVREAAKALLASIEREKGFLDRSVSTMRLPKDALLKLELDAEPAARTGWTVAETFRRLGEDEQAAGFLRAVFASPGAQDWMFLLAREVLATAGEGTPLWTATARDGCGKWGKGLFARLRDPEAAEAAAAVLGRLGDAALVPELLAALKGDDTTAAQFAAAALGGFEEPGAEAEKALAAIVADGDADPEIRWRAIEALLVLSPECGRQSFTVALEGSSLVREPAILGLGRVGEAGAVPLLLAAAKEEPKPALAALSLLAVREFPSVAAAAVWWEKNRSRTRAEWTREALKEAGADLPAVPDRAALPVLAELLENRSLPVRWAAYRLLRSVSGRSLGRTEVLYEGVVGNATKSVVPITVEEVFGTGRIISEGPIPEYDLGEFMGKVVPSLKEDDARGSWQRARALWLRWWREQGGK